MNNEKLRADIHRVLQNIPHMYWVMYGELLNRCYVELGEIDRLRSELGKANSQTAHFEREWYLRGDEIEALTAKLGEQASVPADVQWFDMSTFRPREKDGDVLLYSKNMGFYWVGRLRYGRMGEPQQDELAWRCASSGRFATPSHWMPLPAAPEVKA